jgi:hypothetical protein
MLSNGHAATGTGTGGGSSSNRFAIIRYLVFAAAVMSFSFTICHLTDFFSSSNPFQGSASDSLDHHLRIRANFAPNSVRARVAAAKNCNKKSKSGDDDEEEEMTLAQREGRNETAAEAVLSLHKHSIGHTHASHHPPRFFVVFSSVTIRYAFFLPLTVRAWRRIGFIPLVLIHTGVDDKNMARGERVDMITEYVIREVLKGGGRVEYIQSRASDFVNFIQTARLFAYLLPQVRPQDYIMMSDVDIWPIKASFFFEPLKTRKAVYVYNMPTKPWDQIPMCYVMANGTIWAELMEVPRPIDDGTDDVDGSRIHEGHGHDDTPMSLEIATRDDGRKRASSLLRGTSLATRIRGSVNDQMAMGHAPIGDINVKVSGNNKNHNVM